MVHGAEILVLVLCVHVWKFGEPSVGRTVDKTSTYLFTHLFTE